MPSTISRWALRSGDATVGGNPVRTDSGAVFYLGFEPPAVKTGNVAVSLNVSSTTVRKLIQGVNGQADAQEDFDNFGFVLAAGDFDDDGDDDLGVGVPYEDVFLGDLGNFANAGMAHVFNGRVGGPSWQEVTDYTCQTQNDATQGSEDFGLALAFGKFDDSGRANLAVGAPWKDWEEYDGDPTTYDCGIVYVVAPWRQPRERPHRSSVAYDCGKNIVYSQRMYQRLRPASTTKTLTLLIACEAIDQGFDPDYAYTVPTWVAANVGGSQMDLVAGETISLSDLMKGMMTVSGNDAAYAIGDVLTGDGNPWGGSYGATLPGFQTIMNNAVANLNLFNCFMTNPPGLDVGQHYVTALGWADLAYEAMQNDCVREIVGTSPWVLDRQMPGNFMNGWLTPVPLKTVFYNGFVDTIKGMVNGANGIKGGNTPGASKTGLWSAAALGGEVHVSAFGVRDDDEPSEGIAGDCLSCTGAELLGVAKAACEPGLVLPPPPVPEPELPLASFPGIPTQAGSPSAVMTSIEGCGNDILVELFRATLVKPIVNVRLALRRTTEVSLGRLGSMTLQVPPDRDDELDTRIMNTSESVLDLEVGDGTNVWTLNLQPGDAWTLPHGAAKKTHDHLTVSNIGSSGDDGLFMLEEDGYRYDLALSDSRGGQSFSLALPCPDPHVVYQSLMVAVEGQDSTDEDTVDLSVHEMGYTTSVDDGDAPPGVAPNDGYRLFPPAPNPFNPSTSIRYEIPAAGIVSLVIYDVQGRLVRKLVSSEFRSAGRHTTQWDGHDDQGVGVASGMYLLHMVSEGFQSTQRLVLVK